MPTPVSLQRPSPKITRKQFFETSGASQYFQKCIEQKNLFAQKLVPICLDFTSLYQLPKQWPSWPAGLRPRTLLRAFCWRWLLVPCLGSSIKVQLTISITIFVHLSFFLFRDDPLLPPEPLASEIALTARVPRMQGLHDSHQGCYPSTVA